MTECNRLISEGKLDPSFLESETRCGWFVDEKTKKLWALQIDLVKQIEMICTKYGLTYYLIAGGCIGAIRHNGCIPWDDDLDVAMKREDYNIFMEKAPLELKDPYFLQTPITDPGFYRPHIIIRNSNGTCITKGNQKMSCNNGICIDVFPLDGFEENLECRLFRKISQFRNLVAVTSYNSSSARNHKVLRRIVRLFSFIVFPFGIQHYFNTQNKKCTKLSEKYPAHIGIQYTHFSKLCWTWDKTLFDKIEWHDFEYTKMPIPEGYNEILTSTYRNYMKFPPLNKRGDKHEFEIDPDVPYKKYCQEKYGVVYK